MRLTRPKERAYALGGMQATCKHIDVLKRTMLRSRTRHFGALRASRPTIGGTLKFGYVVRRTMDGSKCAGRRVAHCRAFAISQPPAAPGCLAATRCLKSIRPREDTGR